MRTIPCALLSLIVISVLAGGCGSASSELTPSRQNVNATEISNLVLKRENSLIGTLGLQVEIQTSGDLCLIPAKKYTLKVTFTNLSSTSITLFKVFAVAPDISLMSADVFTVYPQIKTANGDSAYFPNSQIDYKVYPPQPDDFVDLAGQQGYQLQAQYQFPKILKIKNNFVDAPPGNYEITFVYLNKSVVGPTSDNLAHSNQNDWGAWVGQVESNHVEICIK